MVDPFDNKWSSVSSTPVHQFQAVPFSDVLEWASSWELKERIKVVVRFIQADGRIKERSFRSYKAAEKAMSSHDGEYIAYDADYLFDPHTEVVEED